MMKIKKYIAGAVIAVGGVCAASAQSTDIPTTVSTLTGYWTSIAALGITVLVFTVGVRLLRKGVK